MKQMPASVRARATSDMSASMFTPSAASTSELPDLDDAARLPCLATGTPQAATTMAAPVDTLNVPEASPPVPQVSIVPAGASTRTALARMTVAAPVISSTVSPRTRRPIRKAPICAGVASPDIITSKAASACARARLPPDATCARIALKSAISPAPAELMPAPGAPASAPASGSADGPGSSSTGSCRAACARAPRRCSPGGTARRGSCARGGRGP